MKEKSKIILVSSLLITYFAFCTYFYINKSSVYNNFKRDYFAYLKKYENKELILTKTYDVVHFSNGEIEKHDTLPSRNGFRIILQLNGQCRICINTLKKWTTLSRKINFPIENFIIYVHADNYSEFEYMMITNELKGFYAIYDTDSLYLKTNNLHINSSDVILNSCIINTKNKIIAVGSPFSSSYIKEEYCNLLTK
jgi:hypothetical protein